MVKSEFFESLVFFNVNLKQIFGYIIIGLFQLLRKLSLSGLCENFMKTNLYENYIFVLIGICTTFILNTKYNFKIPKYLNLNHLYFFIISNLSYTIQNITYIQLKSFGNLNNEIISFEIDRLLFHPFFSC